MFYPVSILRPDVSLYVYIYYQVPYPRLCLVFDVSRLVVTTIFLVPTRKVFCCVCVCHFLLDCIYQIEYFGRARRSRFVTALHTRTGRLKIHVITIKSQYTGCTWLAHHHHYCYVHVCTYYKIMCKKVPPFGHDGITRARTGSQPPADGEAILIYGRFYHGIRPARAHSLRTVIGRRSSSTHRHVNCTFSKRKDDTVTLV